MKATVPETIGGSIPHEMIEDAMRKDGFLPAISWQDIPHPVARRELSARICEGVHLYLYGPDGEYLRWWGKIELEANNFLGDSTSTVDDNTEMLFRDLLPAIEEGVEKLCIIRDRLLSRRSEKVFASL